MTPLIIFHDIDETSKNSNNSFFSCRIGKKALNLHTKTNTENTTAKLADIKNTNPINTKYKNNNLILMNYNCLKNEKNL